MPARLPLKAALLSPDPDCAPAPPAATQYCLPQKNLAGKAAVTNEKARLPCRESGETAAPAAPPCCTARHAPQYRYQRAFGKQSHNGQFCILGVSLQ